jgi:hypothetical protein
VAIQIQGFRGVVMGADGQSYRTVRVTLRPVDYGSLGQYRVLMWSNPAMAGGLAADSDIYQTRWTAASNLALIWGVTLTMFGSLFPFKAGFANFDLTVARSWTVDGSGGTAATLTGDNQKLRASMASSSMGAIRNATGSSTLTTGTRTLDAQPVGRIPIVIGTSVSLNYIDQSSLYGSLSLEDGGNPAPIVLAQNEGVVVRATVPDTGTWGFGVTMAWSEVATY